MENTKNKLPENISHFFNNLSEVLENKLYFFGSIQRGDYFPGKSDIDVDIFTDNVKSTLAKMQHFLNINKNKVKRFVWRLNDKNNTFASGHKIMYKSLDGSFSAEFSVYNEKFKQVILDEHIMKTHLPVYASWMLVLLKLLYYKLHLLEKNTFIYLKKKIMSFMIGLPDDDFIVLDSKLETIRRDDFNIY